MIATGRAPQRHWASGQDQAIAGLRYVVLFADLETPLPSELNDALSTIAAAGPHTRVALTPQPGRRLWSYDPRAPLSVYQLPDAPTALSQRSISVNSRR